MKPLPPCIFPSVTEEDVITVPGVEPCTAYRLRVEPGMGGYLRIEQLAYNEAMGWYTQKSFCLPGDVVHQLMPHLKQASALLPLPAGSRSSQTGSLSMASLHRSTEHVETADVDVTCTADALPLRFPGPSGATPARVTTHRKTS